MKKIALLTAIILTSLATFAQFTSVEDYRTYVTETIKDKRPEKVTAAQIQTAFLGAADIIGQLPRYSSTTVASAGGANRPGYVITTYGDGEKMFVRNNDNTDWIQIGGSVGGASRWGIEDATNDQNREMEFGDFSLQDYYGDGGYYKRFTGDRTYTNAFSQYEQSNGNITLTAQVDATHQSNIQLNNDATFYSNGQVILDGQTGTVLAGYGVGTKGGTAAYPLGVDATGKVVETTAKYKVYSAIISQSGTAAPTAIVLENTFSGPLTWEYGDVGLYKLTSSGLFTPDKTVILRGDDGYVRYGPRISYHVVSWENGNTLQVKVFNESDGTQAGNGNISRMFIEVRVYD